MMTRRELLIGSTAAVAAAIAPPLWDTSEAVARPVPAASAAPAAPTAAVASPLDAIIGESPGIVALRDSIRTLVEQAASISRSPFVLIVGETGVGKDLAAEMLHRAGPRCAGPYVAVNVPGLCPTLLESELFGYVPGGFNIPPEKVSLWELAQGGTLILDEIGLASSELWPKIVRTIRTQSVRRIAATREVPVDVWTIATSRWYPDRLVSDRTLGEWLAPLDPVVLTVPPLRHRGDDIQLLADFYLAEACRECRKPPKVLTPGARQALATNVWPGNVRQLAFAIERAVLLSEREKIEAHEVE